MIFKAIMETNSPTLSIVVPVYNEAETLNLCNSRLQDVLERIGFAYEIIYVNDGSTDSTLDMLVKLCNSDSRIRVIDLSRNFGKEIALTAGLDAAVGDAVIPIDADLQDPPDVILQLVEKWREGYDVVCATRAGREGETWLKKTTAGLFYRLIGKITDIHIPPNTGDFRLMSRPVVEALRELRERHRFMKGLFSWVGFRQTSIQFTRAPRHKGTTKWGYWKLWNFAIEGITSFSHIPLQIASYVGFLIAGFAFLYGAFLIVLKLVKGNPVPGYPSIMAVILFLGGIQLITLGIIGEYVGRIYDEAKQRPLYVVRARYGFIRSQKNG